MAYSGTRAVSFRQVLHAEAALPSFFRCSAWHQMLDCWVVHQTSPGHSSPFMQAQKPADTASDWKEFTSPDGRKYYHNRKTKESKWTMPEEMKRAQAAAAAAAAASTGTAGQAQKPASAVPPQLVKVPVAQSSSPAHTVSATAQKSPQVSQRLSSLFSAVCLTVCA